MSAIILYSKLRKKTCTGFSQFYWTFFTAFTFKLTFLSLTRLLNCKEMQKFFHFSNFSLLDFVKNFTSFTLLRPLFSRLQWILKKLSVAESSIQKLKRDTRIVAECCAVDCIGVEGKKKASLGINAKENISQWKCATIRAFSSFLAICHDNDLIQEWYLMSCFAPFLPLRFIHMCTHTHTFYDIIYFMSLAYPVEWIFLMDISVVKHLSSLAFNAAVHCVWMKLY